MAEHKLKVSIGQHALERFQERFPQVAESIGFHKKWENMATDPNKQYNTFLLFELFKRAKENKSMYNDLGYVMANCNRHGINDVGNFKLFSNGEVIFITELRRNDDNDTLILKTVIPPDSNIVKYIPKSDLGNVNYEHDFHTDWFLSNMRRDEYLYQVHKMMTYEDRQYRNSREKFKSERLDALFTLSKNFWFPSDGRSVVLNIDSDTEKRLKEKSQKSLKSPQDVQNENALSIASAVQGKLGELGIKYICTLENGDALLYTTNQYVGAQKNKNILKTASHRHLIKYLETDLSTYSAKEIDVVLGMRNIKSYDFKKEMYLRLLMSMDSKSNSTFLTTSELKNLILDTVPEDLKAELKINSKTLSGNISDNFQHYLFKTDISFKAFMGLSLLNNDRRDQSVVAPFFKNENYTLCLCKNKVTDELSLNKFYRITGGRKQGKLQNNSARVNNEEYFSMIEKFVEYFDGLTQDQKMEQSVEQKEIYDFIHKKLAKYKELDNKLSSMMKKYQLKTEHVMNNHYEVSLPNTLNKNDIFGEQTIPVQKVDSIYALKR